MVAVLQRDGGYRERKWEDLLDQYADYAAVAAIN
jgi:hypothetical protein